ncbi:MAG: SAM-dependent methyltransferase, partial [Pseudohongiellaceae bacterium]
DGVLSIGLIFLLSEKAQISVLHKIAVSLKAGGRFLFSSPYQVCEWDDLSTGRKSRSLGRERYVSILEVHGMSLVNEYTDEGESHYFEFQKNG